MADECPKCPPVGAPAWLATFADMMSLLMCFFILLLSMATMDVKKFKKMSDEMKDAFGVQKDVPAYEVPLGTSIIAQHFSPAPTEPTPLEEVKQTTLQRSATLAEDIDDSKLEDAEQKLLQKKLDDVQEQADKIKESLKEEIKQGLVSVDTVNLNIIIRIQEKGSFPSGTAVLNTGFEPVMKKISAAVNDSPGKVHVAGHSDDIPIATHAYRSNWELSASRAVTVSHFLFQQPGTDPNRFVIEGFADTKPLAPNNTQDNRAKNRRVEIIVMQEDPSLSREPFTQTE